MLSSLSFSRGRAIDATLNGRPLDEALGHPGMYGLDDDEWRITARTLQGWMPQELGLERREFVAAGEPIGRGRFRSVPVRPIAQVLVTLPGGDRPEVLAEDVEGLVDYDSVPLLSCECGAGVGCAHEAVSVSFERTHVRWAHGGLGFRFARTSYNRAIETLLTLLGESPRLITDAEWLKPMQTRVFATP